MEIEEQIQRFKEFLEKQYYAELLEKSRKGEYFIVIEFQKLARFNIQLAELLLDNPEETIKIIELSIEEFDIKKPFKVRIRGLGENQKVMVKDIRSAHLNKFLSVEGIVRQKSDVRPQITAARFECPNCGNVITVLQIDTKLKEPTMCGCGRKGRFILKDKELIDAQRIVLEEATEDLEGGEQPKKISILLKADLVSPITDKKTNPGAKIRVNGILKEVPIILRSGSQSTTFDIMIDANFAEPMEESFVELTISKEELRQIKELSQDPKVLTKLIKSVVPSIYGYEMIKEALVLQLMSGVRKIRKDGVVTRGDVHVLLIGDPGSGKSQMLKRISKIAPKGRFISGKGVSGAGLTAAVVKDEFLQGWALEAGALVLASDGICCIDELDKISPDDRSAMHEALEGQTVTISKANIQATLRAETTVLAAANPKFGRFDPYGNISDQIDLPPTLINRFDLIFVVKDLPDRKKDDMMATFILNLHQNPDFIDQDIDTTLLRKYISFARKNIKPKLTDSAMEEIKEYYLKTREMGKGESGTRSIPITTRQLEGLVRLSEAAARVRLSSKVTKKDAVIAIELLDFCLRQIAMNEEGVIDIDKIATGITTPQRSAIMTIKEIIDELENETGKLIPVDDIMRRASERNIDRNVSEDIIEKLKRSGDLFEPKRDFISKV